MFSCVTGADFARSIAWARRQPQNIINAAIKEFLMKPSTHQIQAAINAAEAVDSPLSPAATPVTITHETLAALLYAAKEYLADDGL